MKIKHFLTASLLIAFLMVSCNKKIEKPNPPKPDPEPKTEKINPVSQFAYDGLSIYYKWADKMKSMKPTVSDKDPKKYFEKLLYKADTDHGWSWITDDVESLLKRFEGESLGFGYGLKFLLRDRSKGTYYAGIQYVFPNTPAHESKLKRLDLIGEINGQPITADNYRKLFGNETIKFTFYKLNDLGKLVKDKDVTVTPRKIKTNPVLKDSIYTIGDKKIGYLFYTSFIDNYNNELHKVFSKFKAANVTDLVLDLRYNHGGAISAATYLSSLIAPASAVQAKSPFVKLNFNKFLMSQDWGATYKLGNYSEDEQDPMTANLNLNTVYYIGTGDSFSAAELTPHCLRAVMDNVVHIGNKTGGKYTASVTITPYRPFNNEKGQPTVNRVYNESKLSSDDKKVLRNWAMQPIVAVYTDKNDKDFSVDDGLIPTGENELKEGFGYFANWRPLGDTKDVFLGQALYLITGDEQYKPKQPSSRGYNQLPEETKEMMSPAEKIYSESVWLNTIDIPQNELQEALESNK